MALIVGGQGAQAGECFGEKCWKWDYLFLSLLFLFGLSIFMLIAPLTNGRVASSSDVTFLVCFFCLFFCFSLSSLV